MKIIYPALKLSIILVVASFSFTMLSCDDEPEVQTPVIESFTPTSALPGTSIKITGKNFSASPAVNEVAFNGVSAPVSTATETELTVLVPATATTGKITVTLLGLTGTSATDFVVVQTALTAFSPSSGTVGTTVILTGTNFSTTLSENIVKFNGVNATVSAASATELSVTVPAEATTGKITITRSGMTATSSSDFIVPPPSITSYFPAIAATGISVTITGSNFSSVLTNNIVKFNGVSATVTAASPTQLTVTVPAGATTGALTVKVGPNTATSGGNFQICSGSAELVISDVVVNNTPGATSFTVSFKITNVGSAEADLTKMTMQNYASQDGVLGGDVAASGYSLTSGTTVAAGQSYTTPNYSCNISGGNTTSHPYLIITLFDSVDGTIPECNTDNNIVIKQFN